MKSRGEIPSESLHGTLVKSRGEILSSSFMSSRNGFLTPSFGSGSSRYTFDITVIFLSLKFFFVLLYLEHDENHTITLIQWGFLAVGVPLGIFLWNIKT